MKDLIERLEKAEGPDRELDCHIWVAVCGNGQPMKRIGEPHYRSPRLFCNPNPEINWIGYDLLNISPKYTGSVDDALTMLPKGFRWKLGYSRHIPCVAEVVGYRINEPANIGSFVGECDSNHAIALSIAIMKARVHLRDASEQEAVSPEGADGPRHMEACRG